MKSRPNEEQKTNQEPVVDLFALMGGMANSMQDIAKDTESEEFKAQMDKNPIGTGFGLLFKMMGMMAENMEKAVVVEADAAAEAKPEQQQAAQEEVKSEPVSPRSPRASNSGMFSPVMRPGTPHPAVQRPGTPELYRSADELLESPSPKM